MVDRQKRLVKYLTAFVVEFLRRPTTIVTSSPLLRLPESSNARATDGQAAAELAVSGGWDGTSMVEWADAPLRLMELSLRSTMPRDGGGGGTKWPGGARGVFFELLR